VPAPRWACSGNTTQPVRVVEAATGGCSAFSLVSAASANATNVKSSPGKLLGGMVYNANAAGCYLKVYNSASAPTAGAGTPILRFGVPGSTAINGTPLGIPPGGVNFSNGIGFTLVTGAADGSSTGVAANEVLVDLFWA
jgi:hypothetical protein